MNKSISIYKYCINDLRRSIWIIFYPIFFILISFSFIYFTGDISKSIIGTMNFAILIIPLISAISGIMYFYNSKEFIQILLAMPIKRSRIIFSILAAHSSILIISFIAGMIPLMINLSDSESISGLTQLMICGLMLTLIYSSISFYFGIIYEDRIKGFGWTILFWIITAFLYDGLLLSLIVFFKDYPLERISIVMSILNPIDLTRINVLLNFESASILGYTGAVFKEFFGTLTGMSISIFSLILWWLSIITLIRFKIRKKDF